MRNTIADRPIADRAFCEIFMGKAWMKTQMVVIQTLRIVNCIKSHFGRFKINLTLAFIVRCRDEVKYQQQTSWH
jgi:hypothetical protein